MGRGRGTWSAEEQEKGSEERWAETDGQAGICYRASGVGEEEEGGAVVLRGGVALPSVEEEGHPGEEGAGRILHASSGVGGVCDPVEEDLQQRGM